VGEGDFGSRSGVQIATVVAATAEEALELLVPSSSSSSSDGGGTRTTSSSNGVFGFDVVLMDHHFENAGGVLTGEEAMVQLRSQGHTLPIIMCTGNCSPQDAQRYFKSGASDVWPKPYPTAEKMAASLTNIMDLS
jgi:CheY-like chemotaxis protein